MAWIRTDNDDPEVARLFSEVADPENGKVDHIMAIHALHPAGLQGHFELYRAVMTGTPSLRKRDREMIALVVSQANDCHY